MMKEKETQNRAFLQMLKPALERLEGKRPEEISLKTGIAFDQDRKIFSVSSLGQNIQINYPGFKITPDLDQWHQLIILHYMDMADGTELQGQLMVFGDLPNGMVRGGGFDRQSEREICLRLGNCPQKTVQHACRALGGTLIESNADLCAAFSLLPRFPITMKLWFADEEIPGSGRLFLDKSAGHYLSVEDAVTAGTLLLDTIFKKCSCV